MILSTLVCWVCINVITSHLFWGPWGSAYPCSYMGHWVVVKPWGSARQCDAECLRSYISLLQIIICHYSSWLHTFSTRDTFCVWMCVLPCCIFWGKCWMHRMSDYSVMIHDQLEKNIRKTFWRICWDYVCHNQLDALEFYKTLGVEM